MSSLRAMREDEHLGNLQIPPPMYSSRNTDLENQGLAIKAKSTRVSVGDLAKIVETCYNMGSY